MGGGGAELLGGRQVTLDWEKLETVTNLSSSRNVWLGRAASKMCAIVHVCVCVCEKGLL